MLIHAPSLGIGAGIAAAVIIGVFFIFNGPMSNNGFKIEDITPSDAEKNVSTEEIPKTVKMSTFYNNTSPVLGDVNAPITIVEFGDYQCFYCNRFFHDTEDQINESYIKTGKVKMFFKDYVLIGQDSVVAAHAAHCADEQGKFWQYHDTLYNHWKGENNGWASAENQLKFAKEVDLDITKFTECMSSERHLEKIRTSTEDAKSLRIAGTPAFFVIGPNNKIIKVPGAQPYDVFVNVLESDELKNN